MLIGKFRSQLKVALVLHKVEGRGPSLRGNQGSNMSRASPGVMAMRCKFALLHLEVKGFLNFFLGGGCLALEFGSLNLWSYTSLGLADYSCALRGIAPWEK